MMNKSKVAEIILEAADKMGPQIINWNFKEQWIDAIVSGLEEAEKAETPGAATPRESR